MARIHLLLRRWFEATMRRFVLRRRGARGGSATSTAPTAPGARPRRRPTSGGAPQTSAAAEGPSRWAAARTIGRRARCRGAGCADSPSSRRPCLLHGTRRGRVSGWVADSLRGRSGNGRTVLSESRARVPQERRRGVPFSAIGHMNGSGTRRRSERDVKRRELIERSTGRLAASCARQCSTRSTSAVVATRYAQTTWACGGPVARGATGERERGA